MKKLFKVSVMDNKTKETVATIHVAETEAEARLQALAWMANLGAMERLNDGIKYNFKLRGNFVAVEAEREKQSAKLQIEEIPVSEEGDIEITL